MRRRPQAPRDRGPSPRSAARERAGLAGCAAAPRLGFHHERAAGDGHRDRVRHLRARSAGCQCDGDVVSGGQRLPGGDLGPARRARWDFEEENPLRDARGFDLTREAADSSQLTDEDLGLANVILTNGARLYVDHAHPEYSTPECTNPLDSGDAGTRPASGSWPRPPQARRTVPGAAPIQLYKNNTDNKGASYGCHENYLMRRATPFADIVRHLTPFFVSRQVVCGAGRVGMGADGRDERLPDQPAGRLLRGRGRPGDHAEAADHQHPRRAARRSGEVPPAARDHRRREHERDLHLPQARAPPRWCWP